MQNEEPHDWAHHYCLFVVQLVRPHPTHALAGRCYPTGTYCRWGHLWYVHVQRHSRWDRSCDRQQQGSIVTRTDINSKQNVCETLNLTSSLFVFRIEDVRTDTLCKYRWRYIAITAEWIWNNWTWKEVDVVVFWLVFSQFLKCRVAQPITSSLMINTKAPSVYF